MRRLFLALALLSIFFFISTLSCASIPSFSAIPFCPALSSNSLVVGSGAIHIGLISIALFFLWEKDLKTMLKKLGFPGNLFDTLLYSVGGFMALFALLMMIGIVSMAFGFNDQSKISDKVGDLPWYILALAVLFAPFSEELFFRGLLVPRFGIIGPAILFGLSHLSYGSIVEVLGVFAIGLVFGIIYERSKSITPCIIVHLLYNLVSISLMLFMRSHP